MKFLISLVLTAVFTYALGLYFSWWSAIIAAAIVAICVHQRSGYAFLSGFLGGVLVWGTLAGWHNAQNAGLLAGKVAFILPLNGNAFLLVLITTLLGGLACGLGALTGSFIWPAPAKKSGSKLESREAIQPT